MGYRFLPSHRHFIGTVEQKQRAVLGTEIRNDVHLFDISAAYQLSPRWSLTGSIPIIRNYRNQLYAPVGEFRNFGQGDMTVGARAWLFRPPTESLSNIGVGFAIKLPTGRYNVMGRAIDRAGNPILATADQSIQPGDGGTGLVVNIDAYRPSVFHTWLYFQGTYLFNPRNTNGVSTFRTRPGEQVFSVADQYLYRGGVTRSVPKIRGLAASIGGRMEGVPVRDAFGKSDGFRRPGYAISVEPGFLYGTHGYTIAVNIPVAVERNRKRSLPDYRNGTHGDAAFADYSLIIGVSKRF